MKPTVRPSQTTERQDSYENAIALEIAALRTALAGEIGRRKQLETQLAAVLRAVGVDSRREMVSIRACRDQ